MENDYEVGVGFTLDTTDILGGLGLISDKLLNVQQLIMGTNASIRRMTKLTRDSAGVANTLAGSWAKVAASVGRAADNMSRFNAAGTAGFTQGSYPGGGGYPGSGYPGANAGTRPSASANYPAAGGLSLVPMPVPISPDNPPLKRLTYDGPPMVPVPSNPDNLPLKLLTYDGPPMVPVPSNPENLPLKLLTYDGPPIVPVPVNPENLPAVVPGAAARGPESWPGYKIPGYGSGGTPTGPDSEPNGYVPNFIMLPDEDESSAEKRQAEAKRRWEEANRKRARREQGMNLLFGAMISAGASAAVLRTYGKTLDDAGEMQQQIAIQQGAGIAAKQIALNTKAAWKAANGGVTDVSPQQAMGTITMLRSLLGTSDAARQALDPVLKTEVGLQTALGPRAAASLVQGLKALDISGGMVKGTHISVQKMLGLLPYIAQAMVQTHGVLTGAQILRMMQQAGPAASASSFKSLIMNMAEITAAIGTGAGRGLFQSYMATSVGRVSAVSASYMEKLGLLKASDLHKVKGSSTYLFDPTKLYGANDLKKDGLVDWLHNDIVPYLQKHGDTTPQELIRDISGLLPASTAARVASYVVNNYPQIARTDSNIETGVKTHALYSAAQKVWGIAQDNFDKAWKGLLTSLGMPMIKSATADLNAISGAIHGFTAWFVAHPTMAKVVDTALLAVGGALAGLAVVLAGGAVLAMVGSGGTLALVGAAVAGVGAALTQVPWKAVIATVTGALHTVSQAVVNFVQHPVDVIEHLSGAGKILVAMFAPIVSIIVVFKELWLLSVYVAQNFWRVPDLMGKAADAILNFVSDIVDVATHPLNDWRQIKKDLFDGGSSSAPAVPAGLARLNGDRQPPAVPMPVQPPSSPALQSPGSAGGSLVTLPVPSPVQPVLQPPGAASASLVPLPVPSPAQPVLQPPGAASASLVPLPVPSPAQPVSQSPGSVSGSLVPLPVPSPGQPVSQPPGVAGALSVPLPVPPAQPVSQSPGSASGSLVPLPVPSPGQPVSQPPGAARASPVPALLSAVPVIKVAPQSSRLAGAASGLLSRSVPPSSRNQASSSPTFPAFVGAAAYGSRSTVAAVPPPRDDRPMPVYLVHTPTVYLGNFDRIPKAVAETFSQAWEGVQYGPTGFDTSFSLGAPSSYG